MCDAVNDERYSYNSLEYVCVLKGKTLYFLGHRVLYYVFSRVPNWPKIVFF